MKLMILLTLFVVVFVIGSSAQRRCPQAARPSTCAGPRDVGTRCPRNPPRAMWYYNPATRTCIEMLHLGCGGNFNRWCYLAECQRVCIRPVG